jgi:hypothetical protein
MRFKEGIFFLGLIHIHPHHFVVHRRAVPSTRELVQDDSSGRHGEQVAQRGRRLGLRRQTLPSCSFEDVLRDVHRLPFVARTTTVRSLQFFLVYFFQFMNRVTQRSSVCGVRL